VQILPRCSHPHYKQKIRNRPRFPEFVSRSKAQSSPANSSYLGRIHFSLHYPDLNEESRKAVWSNFIDTVAKQNGKAIISPEDISKLAKYDLNGRQVRDLLSFMYSAVAVLLS
jgi:hypothetical protein